MGILQPLSLTHERIPQLGQFIMSHHYHIDFSSGLANEHKDVARLLAPKSTILEVGSHTGYFSELLRDQGHDIVGVELDKEAAEQARAIGFEVITGNIEAPDVLQQVTSLGIQFDYILLMNVLEHLAYPENVLKNLHGVLKPKGKVIVSGPNIACWPMRRNLVLGKWNYEEYGIMDKTHLRFFTLATWVKLFESSGYRVLSTHSSYFAPLPAERFIARIVGRGSYERIHHFMANRFQKLFAVVFTFEMELR